MSYREYKHLKQVLDSYQFCRNSGNDNNGTIISTSLLPSSPVSPVIFAGNLIKLPALFKVG